jgi:hypothetical protein
VWLSVAVLVLASFSSLGSSILLAGCGKNFYFAGRSLPPSGIANRVLVAIQNPSPLSRGALQIMDAYYDIRHAYNNVNQTFSVSGYSGADPSQIQNFAELQTGVIYGTGDGSLATINYQSESFGSAVGGLAGISSSVYASRNLNYVVAANQQVHAFTVLDRTGAGNFSLNVPGIFRTSINSSGTVALGFIQNSNAVYSIVHLNATQSLALKNGPSSWPTLSPGVTVQDCEPQNFPVYCAVQVNDPHGVFDRPLKAVFSSDGSTAYVLNCGPECGGNQAGVVAVSLTAGAFNTGVSGPTALALPAPTSAVAIPGGVTDALQNGTLLYLSGQQLQPDGFQAGFLTVLDLSTNTIDGTYSISDGTHTKMILADDNTLWIGSQNCEEGERYHQSQSGASVALGCLTLFNTGNNSVFVDSYKGDLTGVTAVTGLHKIYVAEGGQVHIYNTPDGSERNNFNVTVTGTASDVAYMDATSNGDDANY